MTPFVLGVVARDFALGEPWVPKSRAASRW
jgi:hypothetical protein